MGGVLCGPVYVFVAFILFGCVCAFPRLCIVCDDVMCERFGLNCVCVFMCLCDGVAVRSGGVDEGGGQGDGSDGCSPRRVKCCGEGTGFLVEHGYRRGEQGGW